MYLTCSVFLALLVTTHSFAALYVKYDENGSASFSDKPLPNYQLYSPSRAVTSYKTEIPTRKIVKNNSQEFSHKINVMAPSQDETIRSNNGYLLVVGAISPDDIKKYTVQLYIDGNTYGEPQSSLIFNVENIDRGEHQLKLALVSNTGKVIALSDPTTFYMHRNRAK